MISIRDLHKYYGEIKAVAGISFDVAAGEIFGLLGPNGAGKTTLLRVLATLTRPTRGRAQVDNLDVVGAPFEVRNRIGIVFQDPSLDVKLTARENLDFHARMYGLTKPERRERIAEVLHLVDLQDRANSVVETFSGGMKRRLEIARGLLHFPKVLFLDEPTLGLDPQTRRFIWDYIHDLSKRTRVTIILTTHYMDEANSLCDRIGIIDKGRLVALDTPSKLKNNLGQDMIQVEIEKRENVETGIFSAVNGIKEIIPHDGTITFSIENGEAMIAPILKALSDRQITVKAVSLHKPNLEDVFLHYTGRTIREVEESELQLQKRKSRRIGRGRKPA
ncbi:MAG: ATP-binding cassette domain-containing protein [Sedimenticolaceae bacterium]